MHSNINSNLIPVCDDILSNDMGFQNQLKESARTLKNALKKVELQQSSLRHWDKLIQQWINNPDLPLYIRKTSNEFPRGQEIQHKSGRLIIPCDNGPAHWAFSMCFNNNLISIQDVTKFIQNDKIPVAMILKSYEKNSTYKFTKHEIDQPNIKGWKIAHIEAVGLNNRTPLNNLDIELLKEHFSKFMNPKNMFLIPLKYSGLAEIQEVIDIFNQS